MKRFLSSAMLIGVVILLAACSLSYNLFDEKPQPTLNLPPSPTSPSPTTMTSPLPTVVIVLPPPKNTEQQITVYFLDLNRFINAIDPYEVAVTRDWTPVRFGAGELDVAVTPHTGVGLSYSGGQAGNCG